MYLRSTSEEWLIQRERERQNKLRGSCTRAVKQSGLFKWRIITLSLYTNTDKCTKLCFSICKNFPTEWEDYFPQRRSNWETRKEREGNDKEWKWEQDRKKLISTTIRKQEGRLRNDLSKIWWLMIFLLHTKYHNVIPTKNGNFINILYSYTK